MVSFGNNTIGNFSWTAPSVPWPSNLVLTKVTSPVNGVAQSIELYGSGSGTIIPVVYTDSGGPSSLIIAGAPVTPPASPMWFVPPITWPISLGVSYWVGFYVPVGSTFTFYFYNVTDYWEMFPPAAVSNIPSVLTLPELSESTESVSLIVNASGGTLQHQYWNGSAWVNFPNSQLDHILEELSSVGGQEEWVFLLPNTAANRAIVQALPYVQCLYNGTIIFPIQYETETSLNAIIGGLKYSPTTIEVTAYNYAYVKLSQASQTLTKAYTNTPVGTILTYICGLAGVPWGFYPALNVSITFNNANCFKAIQDLAAACGMDYYADSNGINIGTRDSTVQTLGLIDNNSKRGKDYSKTVDSVLVNGVSSSGAAIQGSAYASGYSVSSPGAVATFTVKKISDLATLNNVAALKLQKLNNPSNGNSLECLTSQVATWHPGQYVSCSRPDLDLVGSFIIERITKQAVVSTVEVDSAMPQMDVDALTQENATNDLAGYTAQPTTQIPVNLSLQGLVDLYHLNEGSGTTAKDSTPTNTPINGTISGCTWISNGAFPGELFLSFGSSGSIDCPAAGNSIPGKSAFAIGGWFSPSSIVNLANLIGKANAYILQLYGTAGAIRFGVCVGGAWTYVTSPNGVAVAGQRCFAMGVYDGTNIYLYVSDPSGVNQLLINPASGNSYFNQTLTGNVYTSTADTYIGGSGYVGVIAEVMIWGRAVQPADIQALFFQPLTQVY